MLLYACAHMSIRTCAQRGTWVCISPCATRRDRWNTTNTPHPISEADPEWTYDMKRARMHANTRVAYTALHVSTTSMYEWTYEMKRARVHIHTFTCACALAHRLVRRQERRQGSRGGSQKPPQDAEAFRRTRGFLHHPPLYIRDPPINPPHPVVLSEMKQIWGDSVVIGLAAGLKRIDR